MKTRQEFEAWAIDHGYDIDESKIFGRLYHCDESIRALQVWQAATSRQEAKIKALRDSLTWALSNISEEHYGWPSEEDADAHNAAIDAMKGKS